MNKTILVLSLSVFACSLFSQKTLSWKEREEQDKISVIAGKDEAEVRIYSSLPLTFQSITKVKDKHTGRPVEVKKEGPLNVYIFLFSSLPTYSDRKLKISSKGYNFIEIPLLLTAYSITGYYVWDDEIEGVKGLVNEGNRHFGAGNYHQAKIMYLDAKELLESEGREVEDAIIANLNRVASCVETKEKADKLYNEKKWLEAKIEYEKVIAINPEDKFCKDRSEACTKEHENTPRIVRGTVTDSSGKALAELNIAAEENGKPGIRTITDTSGAYQIRTINKTTELIYWRDGQRTKKITIKGDVFNFIAE